jgi:hypothetical protein
VTLLEVSSIYVYRFAADMDINPSGMEVRRRCEMRGRTYHIEDTDKSIGFHLCFTLPQLQIPYLIWDQHFCQHGLGAFFCDIGYLLLKIVSNDCRGKDDLTEVLRKKWLKYVDSQWQLPSFSVVELYVTKICAGKSVSRKLSCQPLLIDEFSLDSVFRFNDTQLIVEAFFKLNPDWLDGMIRTHVISRTFLIDDFVPRLDPRYDLIINRIPF